MTKLIDKDALVAEIEKRKFYFSECGYPGMGQYEQGNKQGHLDTCDDIISIINTLEVKESQLPNPRFPHLNNIVDKVFGAGNLESWEYEEAEQLVLLAKEELLKDLEVKEVDLEKEITEYINKYFHIRYDETLEKGSEPLNVYDFEDIAKHFFELGLKARQS